MTRQVAAPNGPIVLKNVAGFMILVQTLLDRGAMQPGIGVCHGPSGYGKSLASIYAQNKTGATRVELGDSWTKKTLLLNIARELAVDFKEKNATVPGLAEQVIRALGDQPEKPLIVDEADHAVAKGFLELIREIQEHSGAPVILIGEEKLPGKLLNTERLHNRVLGWFAAQPCDLDDTRALAEAFAQNLALNDDLLDAIRVNSDGRARRIVSNLHRAVEIARNKSVKKLTLSDWGSAPFYTGNPPMPRSVEPFKRTKAVAA
jgi:DNA transposition AAA+ family ATPase